MEYVRREEEIRSMNKPTETTIINNTSIKVIKKINFLKGVKGKGREKLKWEKEKKSRRREEEKGAKPFLKK